MAKVMKYLSVPRGQVVFDYESMGDLFYMVMHGKVLCKIPVYKQIILLNEEEKALFEEEFKDDLMSISQSSQLNHLKARGKPINLDGAEVFKNPYDLGTAELKRYIDSMLDKEKYSILRRYHDEYFDRRGGGGSVLAVEH